MAYKIADAAAKIFFETYQAATRCKITLHGMSDVTFTMWVL
jgi:hypothetical protein